jgi:hypothetical protein
VEIKFENDCRGIPFMAGLDNIGRIDEVLGNGATFNETSLVWVNNKMDKLTETGNKTLGVDLETILLEGDRSEIFKTIGASFFRKKDNIGFIDGPKV